MIIVSDDFPGVANAIEKFFQIKTINCVSYIFREM